jgi:hypothetical protein
MYGTKVWKRILRINRSIFCDYFYLPNQIFITKGFYEDSNISAALKTIPDHINNP